MMMADYELVAPLADVEHGTLWQAVPPSRLGLQESHVTVNVLNQPGSAADLERMSRELSTHSAAQSQYLVPMIEAGRQDETLFYSYGYNGVTGLTEAIAGYDRAQRLLVIADVARAVDALHEVGIAHGDVHPGTIHVTSNSGVSKRGRLSDLGLTQALRPGQTVTGIGENLNLSYRAPELLNGAAPSRSSDIFAIGGVLHLVLAGVSVFPGLAALDLVGSLRFMLAPVADVDPSVTAVEAELLNRCLANDPAQRPGTGAALAAELDTLVVEYGGSL